MQECATSDSYSSLLLGSQGVWGWYSGTAADSEDGLNISLLQEVRSMN
jgi:hypothetical protein